jgi:divalent metal cation (Fe/Co/Zn/Cd) transporter
METLVITSSIHKSQLYKIAFTLAVLTMIFALAEAMFSTYYGYNDESISLFGFGIGSFIEVISAIGVARMVLRIGLNENSNRSNFERTALRITGVGFYILVAGLIFTGIYNIYTGHKPQTTFRLLLPYANCMLVVFMEKTRVVKQLNSYALLVDTSFTKVCIYMSLILLIVSGLYVLIKFPYFDAVGTLGIAFFSFKEGKECFEKAKSNKHCCC